MRTRSERTRYGKSAWLKTFCALCCLVISLGTFSAADVVHEQGTDSRSLSATPDKTITSSSAVVNPDAPDVPGCPLTVLPTNGSTSGNERAPNSNFRFGRSVWLITAAEAAASGLTNGTSPSAIGFNYSAGGVAANGTLVVYLQNTADATNLKSLTWATAITGMTVVSNSAQSLPTTAGTFDLQFSGGAPFTYTGGALYVAFDWQWAGPSGTTAVVLCNTTLVGGLKGNQNATAAPTTLLNSDFRPETRLTPSVGVVNDAAIDFVMTLGSIPRPIVGNQTFQAVVSNRGLNVLNNLPVSVNVTGATAFSNTVNVPTLAACGGAALVTFAPMTPTGTGLDTVTVSVPADDFPANSSKAKALDESFNTYSYKHPGSVASGGVGLTGASGVFVAKMNITQASKVSEIKLEFFATSATTYKAAIYGDSGSGTPSLAAPLYLDAANRTVAVAGPVTITLPTPVSVGPGNFYVGIQQTNTTNASLSFDGEAPIRVGAFYLATTIPPGAWIDFAPGNNFKLNIGATLIQCTNVGECNDNNACTDDACTNNLCTHVNNSSTECDGNTCSSPDACSNGVCTPGPNPCADSDACTQDLCDGQGGCLHPATDCNDNNPCTDDFCIPASGCGHSNNTAVCSDGNPCTIGDVCSGGACVPGSGALPAPVQVCNNGAVSIPASGASTPYPTTITVTGARSYLCSLTVNLNGITHTFPDDIDILLAKGASPNAIIMSDVGGGTDVVGVNLTLSDAAPTAMADATVLVSGTFKPTNIGAGDVFPAPAPAPAGGSALSAFNGTNPNGNWDLWVDDQFTPDSGTMAGWCVNLVAVCTSDADCDDANVCTDDACVNSVCVYTNNTNVCNDSNACTAGDTCTNGVCVGGPPPPCDDGNACTANQCNPGTGLCENPAIVCNDSNACTDDTCAPATGCVYTNNNSNVCSDNNLCTTPDACVNGACVGQNPVVCTPDANPCTDEVCNPGTGLCGSVNNTNACDDGEVCTTGDACGPQLITVLTEDFDSVTPPALPAGWTSTQVGGGQPWATTSASSDTGANSAVATEPIVVADEYLVSPILAIVSASAQLSFANRWSYEFSGASFYDGGVLEISINGGGFTDIVTAGGSFVSGGYTGVISTGFSSPIGGRNAWAAMSAGYPAYLTTVVNLPAAAAGQNIQLRWRSASDSSATAVGQNIDSIVLSDLGANQCQPGGPISCDDTNACTDDFCAAGVGCQHANNNENCDDSNACTILDACAGGSCSGTLIVCDDANPCTLDSCDTGSGCIFAPNPAPGESSGVGAPNKTTYTWAATAGATGYDVVRGSTAAFPVGPGGGDETCLGPVATPSVTDAGVPAVGSGYFYIIRAKNACGNGTYGNEGFHGAPASLRSTTTCP